jgi:4-nitrophenyl phosphatase
VIFRGNRIIEGSREAIQRLKKGGKKLIFLSNNSTMSRRAYMKKFKANKIPASAEEFVLATSSTAEFIQSENPEAKIFLIGANGLKEEIELAGLEIVDDYQNADYLVVGSDPDLTFDKITLALRAVRSGIKYIATNPDKIFPGSKGVTPGTGMMIGALYWMTGRMPDVIVGKPSPVIFTVAAKKLGVSTEKSVVIGDQLETDVAGGKKVKALTVLVLSGVNEERDIERLNIRPDFMYPKLINMLEFKKQ